MSRSVQLATALGGIALAGVGLVPFLHRPETPDSWFQLQWPRELDEDQVLALLRHLASSRRPGPVTFEVRATRGRVTHLVGVGKADTERLRHLFATFLPGVLLEEVERPTTKLARAVELRLGTRERALRTDAAVEVTRSIVSALVGTTGTTILQWQIGQRLAPLHVPKESVGLPSASRAIGQAALYGLVPLDAKARTDLQAKVGDRGFRVNLRIATNITESAVAKGVLRSVLGGLRVAEGPGVLFKARRTDASIVASARPPWRYPLAINVGEIVGLLGWPLGDGTYPGVARMGSRRLPVPPAVPAEGRVFGDGNHPSTLRPVGQAPADAAMSLLVLGPTGTGKSTLLANLIASDIAAGRGVVVVDPKGGDLINAVLKHVPDERQGDVVVFDPNDPVPVGLNPLSGRTPELAADSVVSILTGIFGDGLGPRTTDIIFSSVAALSAQPGGTLAAIPVLLSDDAYRRQVTKNVTDPVSRGFWQWFEQLGVTERATVIAPALNKLRVLLRPSLRAVLAQPEPRFRIADAIDQSKVLLVSLDHASLGSSGVSLLGSIVVSEVWRAIQRRSKLAPEDRLPMLVYLDEWQTLTYGITDLADVLARSRGYGVGWCLANQSLSQLTPALRSAALANCRSKIAYRLAAEDAAVLARSTDDLDASDFQSLGRYEIYASLVADGASQPFCSAMTRALPELISQPSNVRQLSRERYGIDRAMTEAAYQRLWQGDQTPDTPVGSRRRSPKRSAAEGDEQ